MGLLVRVINGPFAFPISHRIRAREKERKRASNQFYYVKGGKISREIFLPLIDARLSFSFLIKGGTGTMTDGTRTALPIFARPSIRSSICLGWKRL